MYTRSDVTYTSGGLDHFAKMSGAFVGSSKIIGRTTNGILTVDWTGRRGYSMLASA